MKDIFPGYYAPTTDELDRLWESGMVVVDANVLLNLYRLPELARNDLFRALTAVTNRLWLPHYAALEFHRNRVSTLSDQKKKFKEVKEICDDVRKQLEKKVGDLQLKKRHSAIDPDSLIDGVGKVLESFKTQLEAIEAKQPEWSRNDSVRDEIDALFLHKVGVPPIDQRALDEIYEQGERRYKKRIPPGYKDAKKEKDDDSGFAYGGLQYRRQFGDLLVWKQLIESAKEQKRLSVMLITDDEKDDWWHRHDGRKIGPRPELTRELHDDAGVRLFWMYTSDTFIEEAARRYTIPVDNATVRQVLDIRSVSPTTETRERRLEEAVFDWLSTLPGIEHVVESRGPFDITARESDGSIVEVEVLSARTFRSRISGVMQRGRSVIREGSVGRLMIVIVANDLDELGVAETWLKTDQVSRRSNGITIVLGVVEQTDDEKLRFIEFM